MKKIAFALLLFFWASGLEAQTPFYQGKTMTIVVGTKAGDVYDLYARLLAQHLPKHIPGNPNIIVHQAWRHYRHGLPQSGRRRPACFGQ